MSAGEFSVSAVLTGLASSDEATRQSARDQWTEALDTNPDRLLPLLRFIIGSEVTEDQYREGWSLLERCAL